ncbi:MAG: cellulose biosynthesis cyclic di-GMP-binding regulatory protein BcsB [Pseudomonadota bacterium]
MNRTAIQAMLISSVALLPLVALPGMAAPAIDAPVIDGAQPTADSQTVGLPSAIDVDANAALGATLTPPEPQAFSVSLQEATEGRVARRLDWRNPRTELHFDLFRAPDIETLSVTLSVDPMPGADPSLPLLLQFNGGDPFEIETNGQGFDTTVTLDPLRARLAGNVLRLTHAVPCDAPSGGLRVDLSESRLDMTVQPRQRLMALRDVETLFASPAFAPSLIGLVSGGPDQTKLQALAAQAVGLRMEDVPDFRLSAGEADFDILMVRRAQLAGYTSDPAILDAQGPQIALSADHTDRLFVTGDTDKDIMDAVSALATSYLPSTSLSTTTPDAVRGQGPIDADRQLVRDRATLDGLSVQTGTHREYIFDVADPAASEGELMLRLNRDDQTPKGSRLSAKLNGETLGEARVRGRRVTVAYPIRQGLLLGAGNRLELVTHDADPRPRCGASDPFIAIADGSELSLRAPMPTLDTDLSRFAADASLFGRNSGADTVMVLPLGSIDFTTALGVVARLAQASGRGWTEAAFERGDTTTTDRHVLRIEPVSEIERHVRLSAPRGLQTAWRGGGWQTGPAEDGVGHFASLDGEQAMIQAARLTGAPADMGPGGVAAVYPSETGHLHGVISNVHGVSFSDALTPLARPEIWNGLKGAVSRWDQTDVAMAQTALPFATRPDDFRVAQGKRSITQHAKAMALSIRHMDWPEPEAVAIGDWVDARWTGFSTTFRERAEAAELERVAALAIDRAESLSETARTAARHAASSELGRSAGQGLTAADGRLAALRTDFWRHLGIAQPEMKAAGIGQAQTLPAALAASILFLMVMIGMAFAGPARR